jgi:hypothetical protein
MFLFFPPSQHESIFNDVERHYFCHSFCCRYVKFRHINKMSSRLPKLTTTRQRTKKIIFFFFFVCLFACSSVPRTPTGAGQCNCSRRHHGERTRCNGMASPWTRRHEHRDGDADVGRTGSSKVQIKVDGDRRSSACSAQSTRADAKVGTHTAPAVAQARAR